MGSCHEVSDIALDRPFDMFTPQIRQQFEVPMLKIDSAEITGFAKRLLFLSAVAIFSYKIGGIALGWQPPLDRETVLIGLLWFPIIYVGMVLTAAVFNGWIALQRKSDR